MLILLTHSKLASTWSGLQLGFFPCLCRAQSDWGDYNSLIPSRCSCFCFMARSNSMKLVIPLIFTFLTLIVSKGNASGEKICSMKLEKNLDVIEKAPSLKLEILALWTIKGKCVSKLSRYDLASTLCRYSLVLYWMQQEIDILILRWISNSNSNDKSMIVDDRYIQINKFLLNNVKESLPGPT